MTSRKSCVKKKNVNFCITRSRSLLKTIDRFLKFSAHGFFADGFLFPVKELGLLTNPGHWVRVLDVVGSYMYIVL
jgi:hypothetical protein